MIELRRRGSGDDEAGVVFVLQMDEGENRFNAESVTRLHAALDEVEAYAGPCALVTTGSGKFFSNGLDLDWMASAGDAARDHVGHVHRLLGRVLGFPAVTVAAVNGHAFAAGAMLATAHDFLVMREDRGYWCLPEVDLGLPLTEAMIAVLAAHLPAPTMHEAAVTGRRYSGRDALEAGVVHQVAEEGEVLDHAITRAQALAGKNRDVVAAHKRLLYGDALALCGA
jgi:enoyl-CoA hydratase/carnithine racemase